MAGPAHTAPVSDSGWSRHPLFLFSPPPLSTHPIRPGLSLWQVPPPPQTASHSSPPRPGLPLWLVPPFLSSTSVYFLIIISPCPSLTLRLQAGLTFPYTHPFTFPSGPACHCGRSRLLHLIPRIFLSVFTTLLSHLVPIRPRLLSLSQGPGLSLWQVPPPPFFWPHSNKFTPSHFFSQLPHIYS